MTFLGIPYKYLALAITAGIVISVVISMIFGMILTYTPTPHQEIPKVDVITTPSPHQLNTSVFFIYTDLFHMDNMMAICMILIFVGVLVATGVTSTRFLLPGLLIAGVIIYLYPIWANIVLLCVCVYTIWGFLRYSIIDC